MSAPDEFFLHDRFTPATAHHACGKDEDVEYLRQWLQAEDRSFWIYAEIVRLREAAQAAITKARYGQGAQQ